jgi:hypothetical protein
LGWWLCPYYTRQAEEHQETMASVVFSTNYITFRNAEKIKYIYINYFFAKENE